MHRARKKIPLTDLGTPGAILTSTSSLIFLNEDIFSDVDFSWRFMFALGALLGVTIIVLRRYLPEVRL
jgi:hypothetical protein